MAKKIEFVAGCLFWGMVALVMEFAICYQIGGEEVLTIFK